MQRLNEILGTIDSYIGSANWFVYFLVGTGIFFTFYLKFPQIRFFRHAIRIEQKRGRGDFVLVEQWSLGSHGEVGDGGRLRRNDSIQPRMDTNGRE